MDQAYKSVRAKLILAAKGLAMGTADIIPGVSGGTIALISGIYDHLIDAISSVQLKHIWGTVQLPFVFWHGERRRRILSELAEIPWGFLLSLISGIIVAMLIMVRIIPYLLEHYPFFSYSFMFGLILFSITVPYRLMQHGWKEYALVALFAAAAFWFVGASRVSDLPLAFVGANGAHSELRTDQKGEWKLAVPYSGETIRWMSAVTAGGRREAFTVVVEGPANAPAARIASESLRDFELSIKSVEMLDDGRVEVIGVLAVHGNTNPLFVFFSGAVAICAMILPGISGAYVLVLLGQYKLMLEALRDVSSGVGVAISRGVDAAAASGLFDALIIVVVFIAGLAVGILSFVRLLKYLLHRYHSLTMAGLTGLMIGSLRAIWPAAHAPEGYSNLALLGLGAGLAAAGAGLVYLLELTSIKLQDPDAPLKPDA